MSAFLLESGTLTTSTGFNWLSYNQLRASPSSMENNFSSTVLNSTDLFDIGAQNLVDTLHFCA